MSKKKKFILLDRDGTIIKEKNYLCESVDVEYIPKGIEALQQLKDAGWRFLVVSNQSGVGRGYFPLEKVIKVNQCIGDFLESAGIKIEKFYICPHRPEDNCNCRKPKLGLFNQAKKEFEFENMNCVLIGDKKCDIDMGIKANVKTILVLTGHGMSEVTRLDIKPDFIANDLFDASSHILTSWGAFF